MLLTELTKKTLALIEELNPNSESLTDDPDIKAKIHDVTNQVMFELIRIKKLPKYIELDVKEGDIITFADMEKKCGNAVYQIGKIGGVKYDAKAQNTVFKILESGTAEIDCFVFPERITDKTNPKAYEFELTDDLLEIMPYGIASNLLKSDESAGYGLRYAETYEAMKQGLDPRYQLTSVFVNGGYDV